MSEVGKMAKTVVIGDESVGFHFERGNLPPRSVAERTLKRLTDEVVTEEEREAALDVVDVKLYAADVRSMIANCRKLLAEEGRVVGEGGTEVEGAGEETDAQKKAASNSLQCFGFGAEMANVEVLQTARVYLGAVEPARSWTDVDRQMKAAAEVAGAGTGLLEDKELLEWFLQLEQAKSGMWARALQKFRDRRGEAMRAALAQEVPEEDTAAARVLGLVRAGFGWARVAMTPSSWRAHRASLEELVVAHRAEQAAAATAGGVASG